MPLHRIVYPCQQILRKPQILADKTELPPNKSKALNVMTIPFWWER